MFSLIRAHAAWRPLHGARIGAALRRARERSEGDYSSGERAAPIGHVRRAHWHTYWVGSEKRGNRRRQLRWLSPMLVNVRDEDGPELVAAIHPVDSEAGEELTPEQVQLLTRIADAGDAGVERPTQWHGASVAGWQHTADALVIRGLIRWDHGEAAKRAPGYRITVEGTARLAAFRRRT